MAFNIYEFKFPDVGEGIAEGKLVDWKIGVGDNIKIDQTICSVETDKAIVDIPSPVSGKVVELLNKVDDTLVVGNIILTIDVGNNDKTIPQSNKEHEIEKEKIISQTNSDEKIVNNGEKSYKIQGLSEMGKPQTKKELSQITQKEKEESTPKIKNQDITTNSDNIKAMLAVRKFAKDNNIDLGLIIPSGNHGQIIMSDLTGSNITKKQEFITEERKIESNKPEQNFSQDTFEDPKPINKNINNDGHKFSSNQDLIRDVIASPNVRQIALQKGIDITSISGSGEGGRIILEDLENTTNNKKQPTEKSEIIEKYIVPIEKSEDKIQKINQSQTDSLKQNNVEDLENHHLNKTPQSLTLPHDISVPYDNIRSIIANKMSESLQNTAQLTLFQSICIDNLVEFRNKEKDLLKEKGIKLTYLPFFVKAFIAAAKEFPYFNATTTKDSIILKSEYNIGIAMDTQRGLLVPNIFNAQSKSIIQIAKDISQLSQKGKENKISLEDMSNGSFTITSLGKNGGKYFTPILNYPQTGILGIGEISKQPIVSGDEIIIGNVLHLSLTFDHRAIDGAQAAKFFAKLCELLKDVELLLMEA